MSTPKRHISTHSDRLRAAQVASRLLISKRALDRETRIVLEDIALQRDAHVDVLGYVLRLEQREGGAVK